MKKVLCFLLAYAILMTILVVAPITAEAKKSGDFVYTVTDGEAEITLYNGSASDLAIPPEFDGVPVTIIGDNAFNECNSLTRVIIPDTVISIGYMAFYKCTSLTSVTMGNSVTTIHDWAFATCPSLESISFSDSLTTVAEYAFDGTAWIKSQPDGIVYAGNVIYKVKGECPAEVTMKVGTKAIADSAFRECNGLKSVIISDSVSNIGQRAFMNCKALENVTIGSSVTSINYDVFSYCVSLESVTIPVSVKSIKARAFYNCGSLECVTVLNPEIIFDGQMLFDNCSLLTIYGYRNSTAESYARGNNIPFIPLDGEPSTDPPTEASPTAPAKTHISGDVDGDGVVSIIDATQIQKYLASLPAAEGIGEPIG